MRGDDVWTGDLAYRDADGWFWFAGRSTDWLRVNSENFAAAPVERVLARFPGVAVAAVYPVPDPRTGDQVMATLQLEDGRSFDPAGVRGLPVRAAGPRAALGAARSCASRCCPVTATRKVDKPALRRQAWDGPGEVYERVASGPASSLLTESRRAELRAELAEHGRLALLGT